jgi:hypothetical protein
MRISLASTLALLGKGFKQVNNFFINVLLFIFYFVFIGVGKLLYSLRAVAKENSRTTNWKKFARAKFKREYFESPY